MISLLLYSASLCSKTLCGCEHDNAKVMESSDGATKAKQPETPTKPNHHLSSPSQPNSWEFRYRNAAQPWVGNSGETGLKGSFEASMAVSILNSSSLDQQKKR